MDKKSDVGKKRGQKPKKFRRIKIKITYIYRDEKYIAAKQSINIFFVAQFIFGQHLKWKGLSLTCLLNIYRENISPKK